MRFTSSFPFTDSRASHHIHNIYFRRMISSPVPVWRGYPRSRRCAPSWLRPVYNRVRVPAGLGHKSRWRWSGGPRPSWSTAASALPAKPGGPAAAPLGPKKRRRRSHASPCCAWRRTAVRDGRDSARRIT